MGHLRRLRQRRIAGQHEHFGFFFVWFFKKKNLCNIRVPLTVRVPSRAATDYLPVQHLRGGGEEECLQVHGRTGNFIYFFIRLFSSP